MPQMFMAESPDQAKKRTMEELGDVSQVDVFLNQVLLAVYERPKVTASGIHLSDKTLKEDEFQGKAALVVKLGPTVDGENDRVDFHGRELKVGDWVAIWTNDGAPIKINSKPCRLVPDYRVFLRIPRPDMVW